MGSDRRSGHWDAVARGEAYLRQGRPDLAIQAVSHVRDEGPGAGEAMTVAGRGFLAFQDLQAARMALERALKLQPNQPRVAKLLATICLSTGDAARGLQYLAIAAHHEPTDIGTWEALGKVHHDLDEPAEAAKAFAEVLRRAPHHRGARVALIGELLNSGRSGEATAWIAEALRDQPEGVEILGLAARHAYDSGRSEDASALADRTLARDPNNRNALLVRAKMRLVSDDPEGARKDLQRAVAVNPNDLGALQSLAMVEARLGLKGRAQETAAMLRKARQRATLMGQLTREISDRPDDPEPRWRMGHAAMEGGQAELARRCFQAALALDPSCRPAREGLASLDTEWTGTSPAARRAPRARETSAPAGSPSSLPD